MMEREGWIQTDDAVTTSCLEVARMCLSCGAGDARTITATT